MYVPTIVVCFTTQVQTIYEIDRPNLLWSDKDVRPIFEGVLINHVIDIYMFGQFLVKLIGQVNYDLTKLSDHYIIIIYLPKRHSCQSHQWLVVG